MGSYIRIPARKLDQMMTSLLNMKEILWKYEGCGDIVIQKLTAVYCPKLFSVDYASLVVRN